LRVHHVHHSAGGDGEHVVAAAPAAGNLRARSTTAPARTPTAITTPTSSRELPAVPGAARGWAPHATVHRPDRRRDYHHQQPARSAWPSSAPAIPASTRRAARGCCQPAPKHSVQIVVDGYTLPTRCRRTRAPKTL
jgi:hypothetical protein